MSFSKAQIDKEYMDKATSQPQAPDTTWLFNPPTASEYTESQADAEERQPWSMRRVMQRMPTMARVGPRPPYGQPDNRPARYYTTCVRAKAPRSACFNQIEAYRVVTGTHAVVTTEGNKQVEDAVYYWPDTAIVVEIGTDYTTYPRQYPFCSHKCLSLWSAKIARDSE